ncbi:MAG: carboxypeptidase-like regulatory domain-containing protein, partial [Mucilaginibacter sp.]
MKSTLQIASSPHRKKFPGRLCLLTGILIAGWVATAQPSLASVKTTVSAQKADVKVSGKVTDEKGLALPGVSVSVKGTTTGIVTDVNGGFTLNVPNASTLVFRYVGYLTQEIVLNDQATINVQLLPDARSLNEVVVVGYGTQRKATLTGSISQVKGAELVKSP